MSKSELLEVWAYLSAGMFFGITLGVCIVVFIKNELKK